MRSIIENHFKKISDQKYVVVNRQLWVLVSGIILIPLPIYFFIDSIINGICFGFLLFLLVVFIIPLTLFIFFLIARGFYSVTTEIDFSSLKARITQRNIRGASATSEAFLDNICIGAKRMGLPIRRVTIKYLWIVSAGFVFEGWGGEDSLIAIWSKVVDEDDISERNEIMFELYRFFSPDCPAVDENNLVTNGNVVMLLSHE